MFEKNQTRLILAVLAGATALFAIVYFAFLRSPMVPVYQNIRESDASAIVAELERAGVPYRLENEGHDIHVPEDQAAKARVEVAGSDLAMGGTVGFELFNDSDMGLTEFAQKINFQRAMQGELARTIMGMEGVEFARVHLALPERSIFRSEQGEPTAAVTLQMTPGAQLTRQRVEGVRELIASSVPSLSAASVVILDDRGDLVSGAPTSNNGFGAPLTERGALEQYYQTLARQAIGRVLSAERFEITVNARRTGEGGVDRGAELRDSPDRRNVVLSVLVRTQSEIEASDREAVEAALADALGLERARGDSLVFSLGLTGTAGPPAVDPLPVAGGPPTTATAPVSEEWTDILFSRWAVIVFVLLALLALAVRPRRQLDDQGAEDFGELLRNAVADERLVDAR
jgi:flagellar M-ring protein FliF